MFDFLFELVGFALGGGSTGLNTKKIDMNIDRLKQQAWFKQIYEDEKYRKMFFTNRHIRAYLQSNYRVNKIIKNEKSQMKLMMLLNKQLIKNGQSG